MATGQDLIALGFRPGPWFKDALTAISAAGEGADISAIAGRFAPPVVEAVGLRPTGTLPFHLNIRAENSGEAENIANVEATMRELMRVPTVVSGAVMPDACPAGPLGTIPVGGVIATKEAIHPGMHSADICCSVALTVLGDIDPRAVLDAGMARSHFGAGGRPRGQQIRPPAEVMAAFEANAYLHPLTSAAIEHFGTQGDGNHFFYVGRLASTGRSRSSPTMARVARGQSSTRPGW